jgi:hypothetical protein
MIAAKNYPLKAGLNLEPPQESVLVADGDGRSPGFLISINRRAVMLALFG